MKKFKIWVKYVLLKYNKKKIGFFNRILALIYGFSADFFDAYKLNKNNIKDYIPEYKRVLSREIDGEFKVLLDDKILFTDFFKQYVKVPSIVCGIRNNKFFSGSDFISYDSFLDLISNDLFVIKPVSGGGGHGVHIISVCNNTYFIDRKEVSKVTFDSLIYSYDNAIVNSFVNQHEYSNNIFPNSVNTIRVVSIVDPDSGDVSLPFATHRFGTSKTGGVDNASSGGIFSLINMDTGVVGFAKKFGSDDEFLLHPDTGSKIQGVVIPNWEYIKERITKVASELYYIPFIAWDIVVTNDGFEVIELNPSCSLELFQCFGSIKGSLLWDFYKKNGLIK